MLLFKKKCTFKEKNLGVGKERKTKYKQFVIFF